MKKLFLVSALLLVLPFIICMAPRPLPDTGQTKCYDAAGNEIIPCPSSGADFYGQDANYALCNPASYTKLDANGNDLPVQATEWVMVRDNVMGLIWENKTDDGGIHDKDNAYNRDNVQSVFITNLNLQNFGGHNDWRLPTIKELSRLVDSSIPYPGPTININYFPNTQPSEYWSSTSGINDPSCAWAVSFNQGYVDCYDKSSNLFVRAVWQNPSGGE